VQELDPGRRYIPTSPLDRAPGLTRMILGKGALAVHGPNAGFKTVEEAEAYWSGDDALFRPEVYCPGASTVELIHKYAGDLPFSRLTTTTSTSPIPLPGGWIGQGWLQLMGASQRTCRSM